MKKALGCFLSMTMVMVVLAPRGYSQTYQQRQSRLLELFDEANQRYQKDRVEIEKYSRENGIPVVQRNPDGSTILLQAIDEKGNPIYVATDNAGAAITTGVDKVRSGGGLGLNLTGEGIRVSIWDGGKISDHIEFAGRMQLNEGSTDDNHATHVLGTIAAEGINPSAKGMAPKALLTAWDFENDLAEIVSQAKPDQTGTILSNHSYDQVSGWRFNNNQWTWFGDASVSTQEDWRFGFYGQLARSWDEVTYNSPYYTIVKSAGNDRSDVGNGSRPPDCNAGTGFDCIGVRAVAKNIITVGAIRKLTNYQEPANVQMSSFSAWGPTDDGRIKPDLVAAGVELFSTSGSGINQYTTLSGTSMATPNVTGSLALLQELYSRLNNGALMRSSTLKALAIHTTKEAGPFPGPDYSYGWGLLDVGAAAKVLLDQDDQNVFVIEDTLRQNQTFSLRIQPQAGKKIAATIAWTDPAAIPVAASLDPINLMLVNDLDLKLRNDAGGVTEPWTLNPVDPAAQASRGNNFRDNVEKLEFDSPEPRDYTLLITHKGNITGPYQVFSLVLTYSSLVDPRPKMHWVGGTGDWNDPAKWSNVSGGTSANRIPTSNDRVIFDENSFANDLGKVSFSGPASCYSLTVLSAKKIDFDFQQNALSINAHLIASNAEITALSAGQINFVGSNISDGEVIAPKCDFRNVRFQFSGNGSFWQVKSDLKIEELKFLQGGIAFGKNQIETTSISIVGTQPRSFTADETNFVGLRSFVAELQPLTLAVTKTRVNVAGASNQVGLISNGGLQLPFEFVVDGPARLAGSGTYESLNITGELEVTGSNSFNQFVVNPGSTLNLGNGTTQRMSRNTAFNASAQRGITIRANGKAVLDFTGHYKLCFDFLNVVNTDLTGSAVINAGAGSVLSGSNNWFALPCADVLFPDFSFAFACKDGLTQFTDTSSGLFDQRVWSFGSANGSSVEKNPVFQFTREGIFPVTLTLSKGGVSRSFSQSVAVIANSLPTNEILFSSSTFFSTVASPSYQWYKNMIPIEGARSRSYTWTGEPGQFFVLIANENCNRPSNTVIITGLQESISEPRVFPNPVDGVLRVHSVAGTSIQVIDPLGRVRWSESSAGEETQIDTSSLEAGVYFIRFSGISIQHIEKILVIH